jgi:hypothetical protein
MKRLFIQTSIFSKRLDEQGVPNLLELIEEEILDTPQAGDVVPGSGGVRKLRVADSSRGFKSWKRKTWRTESFIFGFAGSRADLLDLFLWQRRIRESKCGAKTTDFVSSEDFEGGLIWRRKSPRQWQKV